MSDIPPLARQAIDEAIQRWQNEYGHQLYQSYGALTLEDGETVTYLRISRVYFNEPPNPIKWHGVHFKLSLGSDMTSALFYALSTHLIWRDTYVDVFI